MRQPTVCACYIEAGEPEALQRSLDVMSRYPWIKDIVVVHSDRDEPTMQFGKVKHIYKNYGHGFDKQPEDGGFDEVSARNHALTAGRATGCDWLLVIDADEFFLPSTYQHILLADQNGMSVIFFECFHFFSPTQYLRWKDTIRAVTPRSPKLHDPHIRAIRSSAAIEQVLNPDLELRNRSANRTSHCTYTPSPASRVECVAGMFHIHTHHMYGSKRDDYMAGKKLADLPLQTVRADVFPRVYLDAYTPYRGQPCHSPQSAHAIR